MLPTSRQTLGAGEIAALVGCHRSTIYRAWDHASSDRSLKQAPAERHRSTPDQVSDWMWRTNRDIVATIGTVETPGLSHVETSSGTAPSRSPQADSVPASTEAHEAALAIENARLRIELVHALEQVRRWRRLAASNRAALRDALQRLASERVSAQAADRSIERFLTDQAQEEDEAASSLDPAGS